MNLLQLFEGLDPTDFESRTRQEISQGERPAFRWRTKGDDSNKCSYSTYIRLLQIIDMFRGGDEADISEESFENRAQVRKFGAGQSYRPQGWGY
jgi:hypothetical protein